MGCSKSLQGSSFAALMFFVLCTASGIVAAPRNEARARSIADSPAAFPDAKKKDILRLPDGFTLFCFCYFGRVPILLCEASGKIGGATKY